jgi:hypothetical protein
MTKLLFCLVLSIGSLGCCSNAFLFSDLTKSAAFMSTQMQSRNKQQQSSSSSSTIIRHGTRRPDSSDEIQEALKFSKEYGAFFSPDAGVAWDMVEELDSSNKEWHEFPAVTTLRQSPSKSVLTTEQVHTMDYAKQVAALVLLLEDTKEKMEQIKTLACNMKQLDLEDPTLRNLPLNATELKTFLAEAKAAVETDGGNSKQAITAWEAVDACLDALNGKENGNKGNGRYPVAAIKAHHYYDAVVDSVFLQDSIDAIEALVELRRFAKVEHERLLNADYGRFSP